VRAHCCWSCCARSVLLELLWRPIPELLYTPSDDGSAVRAQWLRSSCARSVLELQLRPIPELQSALDVDGAALYSQC